jgi:hypothetical protein
MHQQGTLGSVIQVISVLWAQTIRFPYPIPWWRKQVQFPKYVLWNTGQRTKPINQVICMFSIVRWVLKKIRASSWALWCCDIHMCTRNRNELRSGGQLGGWYVKMLKGKSSKCTAMEVTDAIFKLTTITKWRPPSLTIHFICQDILLMQWMLTSAWQQALSSNQKASCRKCGLWQKQNKLCGSQSTSELYWQATAAGWRS